MLKNRDSNKNFIHGIKSCKHNSIITQHYVTKGHKMGHIFLCGFMGCGKSTIGRQLAKLVGVKFIDLDQYIVESAKMTIPQIFEKYGENHFRQLEVDSLKKLIDSPPCVIAFGGGTVTREENVKNAKSSGKIIFLNPSFKTCYNRIKNDKNRPLVINNSKDQLFEIYKQRENIYRDACDLEICETYPPYLLARSILKKL